MNTNNLITLLSIVLPLVGAGIGYLVRHIIEKKRELLSEINKERRAHYQLFVDIFVEFTETTGRNEECNFREKLYSFFRKYLLYASPEVIKSFGDFVQLLGRVDFCTQDQEKNCLKAMTKIILCMRKDIGLKNRFLGRNGEKIMRGIYKDYDLVKWT
ncbi:MAG: hypothetical protein LBV38_01345 [Alistipes sp.]|jgi:hypothetical protein|nr:hypothetical protein [Alistipes sp.]